MAAAEPRRAHDLNVRRVPHALRGDICVRVDTTCLGPDKSHLIDTEKGADKRPSGAGERCTMPGTGTTRKGGGSREAGGSGVAFKDTSSFHIYKKKKEKTQNKYTKDPSALLLCKAEAFAPSQRNFFNEHPHPQRWQWQFCCPYRGRSRRGDPLCQVGHVSRDNWKPPPFAQSPLKFF